MNYDDSPTQIIDVDYDTRALPGERLRRLIGPKCAELLSNAELAITGALRSTDGLTKVETLGTGSTPGAHQNAIAALVAVGARTHDDKAAFEIFATVGCLAKSDHLVFERKPVSIVATRRHGGGTCRVRSTFKRVRGSMTSTSYELDVDAFKAALRDASDRLARMYSSAHEPVQKV